MLESRPEVPAAIGGAETAGIRRHGRVLRSPGFACRKFSTTVEKVVEKPEETRRYTQANAVFRAFPRGETPQRPPVTRLAAAAGANGV